MNSKVTERFIGCYGEIKAGGRVRSARQFAMSLEFHPQSWNEILKGRRDVTLTLIERAVAEYQFNPMFLYTGEGNAVMQAESRENLRVLTVVTDHDGNENILHVPMKAQAGYATQSGPLETADSLMTYSLPGMEHRFGTFRSFEIEGDSMTPTVQPGEIVICRYIQPDFWEKQIQDDQVFVVVSNDDLVLKRVKNRLSTNEAIHLYSDNEEFEPYLMQKRDIQEMWFVEKVIRCFDQRFEPKESVSSKAELLELVKLQSGLLQELHMRAS